MRRPSGASKTMDARRPGRLLCLAFALISGASAWAGTSGSLSVSAAIVSKSNCKFSTVTPATISLAINPTDTLPVSGSVVWSFKCAGSANTAVYVVSAGNGANFFNGERRMKHVITATEFLPYSLSFTPATGSAAKNAVVNVTLTATVAPAAYASALVGNYSDTVQISLDP